MKQASFAALPDSHFASHGPISVTLYYLPEERMQGDVDNIVKPILDALCKHVYIDDHQVERVVVQKFEPGIAFTFDNPTETIASAIECDRPVLYVRLSDKPLEEFE